MVKEEWTAEKIAEAINLFRVFPRMFMIIYGWTVVETTKWYMELPDPSNAQSIFISTIWTASAGWFGFYVKSGKKEE